MEGMRNASEILLKKRRGKWQPGITRYRWESNIKTDLIAVGCKDGKWIQVVQDMVQWLAVLNTIMGIRVL
jgi:hypothetical protein